MSSSDHVERNQRFLHAEATAFKASLDRSWRGADLPDDVVQVLAYIHAHLFDEKLNAAHVHSACGLKNHNFSCRFKRTVGVGMHTYIEVKRMAMAKRLLGHKSLNILHIAWAVGYAYPETFARAFRRNVGCSASQYRKGLLPSNGARKKDEAS